MISLSILASAFALVLVAELGDKTQLVAFSLTTATEKPLTIFLSTSAALVVSTVIASILGGIASNLIPGFVSYISSGLFIVFGVYILLSRGGSKIEEAFLNTITLEKSCIKLLEKLYQEENIADCRIMNIRRQEHSHQDMFRLLLKERHLFREEINDDENLAAILERLVPCKKGGNRDAADLLHQLIDREQASIDFFTLLLPYVDRTHDKGESVETVLREMIQEETEHKKIFSELLRGCS